MDVDHGIVLVLEKDKGGVLLAELASDKEGTYLVPITQDIALEKAMSQTFDVADIKETVARLGYNVVRVMNNAD